MSSREWAIFIIAAVGVMAVLYSGKTRGAFLAVLRALCQRSILTVLLAGGLYVAVAVYGLNLIGLWRMDDVSATVIWALTSAAVTIFNFEKAKTETGYYRKAFWEVFTFTSVFVFVTDLLNISLWFWLIAIPILTVIQLMVTFSEGKPDVAPAHKFLSWLLALFGFGLLFYVIGEVVSAWAQVATWETLRLFALSGALSIVFLPFIYALVLFATYETAFSLLAINIDDPKLRRAAKWRAFWRYRTDLDALERWRRRVGMVPPQTKDDLDAIFNDIDAIKDREANPRPVAASAGWQPQETRGFLADDGLKPNDYTQLLDLDEWSASSSYLEFGDGIMPNNVCYYLTGTADAVTRLRLKLNVNVPSDDGEARDGFTRLCQKLTSASVGQDAAKELAAKLAALNDFEERFEHVSITLKREQWQRADNGHAIIFTIASHAHRSDM